MNVNGRNRLALAAALATLVALAVGGCSERDLDDLSPARAGNDPVVFDDRLGDAVDYQAFAGSNTGALSIDNSDAYLGTASLRIVVPPAGAQDGTYAGGAFTTNKLRDLSIYDALTFYAKSSVASTLNVAGLGNDNTGTSKYDASRENIELTTDWRFYVIPVPDPTRLTLEGGLFYFAEGFENPAGHTIWFDEIRYANVGTISDPRPAMTTKTADVFIGSTIEAEGTHTIFSVAGNDVTVGHFPAYFNYSSSDEAVASTEGEAIEIVGAGTATITAALDTVAVDGVMTLTAIAGPEGPAAAPTHPAGDVISLLSDAYTDVTVDTWNTHWQWSTAQNSDFAIDGDNMILYTDLNFVGIEFLTSPVDATAMTHFHLDVWAPSGADFKVKLVAFNAAGNPVAQPELTFTAATTPAFTPGQWCSLDIPLADFNFGSATIDRVGQLVLSATNTPTVFVDNVYFHR